MVTVPQVKDLQAGIVRCSSCGAEHPIDSYDPLGVSNCGQCNGTIFYPMRIKNYWLYQPLGGGGMGSVYKAVQEGSQKEFAIKVLPRQVKNNPDLINALKREAQAGSAICNNPLLIKVIDSGQEGDEHFIITEFIYGDRLDNIIDSQGHIDEKLAVDIIMQLVEAEMHICRQGYLFRDMKPENVFYIENSGTIKLFDYGLCITMAEAASDHTSDDLEGSPFYMPPERVVGAAEGEYSEVYSLGMLFYYLLSGKTFYSQAEIDKLVTKHVSSLRMSSVSNRLKHCAPALVPVVDKMIARTPTRRYHDLGSLKEDLEKADKAIKSGGSSVAVATSTRSPGGQTSTSTGIRGVPVPVVAERSKSKKLLYVGIALVILTLILMGGGGFFFMQIMKKNQIRRELTVSTAAAFGVAPDILPVDLSRSAVEQQIPAKTAEILKKKSGDLSPFSQKSATKEICSELGVGIFRKNPKHSIAELDKIIQKNLRLQINKEKAKITSAFNEKKEREIQAKRLKFTLPAVDPKLSTVKVKRAFRKYVITKVKEKYPSQELAKKINEVMKKCQGYRIGDTVNLTDPAGVEVKGRYSGREGNKIVIGDRKLLVHDIPRSELWKFNDVMVQERTSRGIKLLKEDFNKARKNYQGKLLNAEEEAFFKQHGYIKRNGSWQSPKTILDAAVSKQKSKYLQSHATKIKNIDKQVKSSFHRDSFIRKHGYCKVDGKWYEENKAVNLLMTRKKNAFELKRKAQLSQMHKESQEKAKKELFTAHRFVFHEGQWQEARTLIDSIVARDLEKKLAEAKQGPAPPVRRIANPTN